MAEAIAYELDMVKALIVMGEEHDELREVVHHLRMVSLILAEMAVKGARPHSSESEAPSGMDA